MKKPISGADLAEEILSRSTCAVQVGAAIADKHGVFSWGWNSSGPSGYGQCAEQHAIKRANKKRLQGALIFIVGKRNRNDKFVYARPCETCQKLIDKHKLRVCFRSQIGWTYIGPFKWYGQML